MDVLTKLGDVEVKPHSKARFVKTVLAKEKKRRALAQWDHPPKDRLWGHCSLVSTISGLTCWLLG